MEHDRLVQFSNILPKELIPSILRQAFRDLNEEQTERLQALLDNHHLVSMAIAYAYTPINEIKLRLRLLNMMIPKSIDLTSQKANRKIHYMIGKAFAEAKRSIPEVLYEGRSYKEQTPLHNRIDEYWNLFYVAYKADLIKAYDLNEKIDDPRFKGKSLQDIREVLLTVKPPYEENGATIREEIHQNPFEPNITQRLIDHPEWERLESHIFLTIPKDVKQWEYDAVTWLTENYQLLAAHPSLRNKLLLDTGWAGKPFSHWVIIRLPNGKEYKFSMSLVGKLQNLVKRHFRAICEMTYKEHGDIHILVPEIIKKMKNPEFLDQIGQNTRFFGDDIQAQKLWLTSLVLHKLALECPRDVERIVGWYELKVKYEALRANQPEVRRIKAIRRDPLDRKNELLSLDQPFSDQETATPYDLISISDNLENETATRQIFDLIMSDLSEDEQAILNDEKDGFLQRETAKKLGVSEASLSKKKAMIFEKLRKKYKAEYNS